MNQTFELILFKRFFFIRKRSFLILELMIGIAIIVMCIIPLALGPIKKSKSLIAQLVELEMQKEASLIAADIKKDFYKQKIKIEKLSRKRVDAKSKAFLTQDAEIVLPNLFYKKYVALSYLTIDGEKKNEDKTHHYLVKLTIYFTLPKELPKRKDPHYEYIFTVTEERLGRSQANKEEPTF